MRSRTVAEFNYWRECLSQSFDEHGITATPEQIAAIARDVEGASETTYLASPTPEHPAVREAQEATRALEHERALVFCIPCQGHGRIEEQVGPWWSNSDCWKCHGKGKHLP
jgi:hypothetical protein